MNGRLICLLIMVAFLGLLGCASNPQRYTAPADLNIECLIAYRSSIEVGIESEEVVLISAAFPHQSINFQDLTFHAQYFLGDSPPHEHGLQLWVTPTGSEAKLVSQLYQLPLTGALRNQFSGGHGFSGLSYVYHPTSQAELQYTCSVQR